MRSRPAMSWVTGRLPVTAPAMSRVTARLPATSPALMGATPPMGKSRAHQ